MDARNKSGHDDTGAVAKDVRTAHLCPPLSPRPKAGVTAGDPKVVRKSNRTAVEQVRA